jgi:hypothetical protein
MRRSKKPRFVSSGSVARTASARRPTSLPSGGGKPLRRQMSVTNAASAALRRSST